MTTVEDLASLRAAAFRAARDVVAEWRASGRHTTTAGVTSALKQSGVIDLAKLEISSNREFWEQAAASGFVRLEQQMNGHWLLLLQDERLSDLTAYTAVDRPPRTSAAPVGDAAVRLKSDVWTSFVDWNPAYRRFWDKHHARAFMVPASPEWTPSDIDESRFTEIEPAGHGQQVDWMRSFAEQLLEPDRTALLISLADHAPRGAFSRELRERGLSSDWRVSLRNHILESAVAWADRFGIEISSVVESRPRDTDRKSRVDSSAREIVVPASAYDGTNSDEGDRAEFEGRAPDARVSFEGLPHSWQEERTSILRERLHKVIDEMTRDELGHLPIRAEHLIRF